MIGILYKKRERIVGKSGFKILKFTDNIRITDTDVIKEDIEIPVLDYLPIEFGELDINAESMSAVILNSFHELDRNKFVCRQEIISKMNYIFMERFKLQYSDSIKEFNVNSFSVLDVIDLENIDLIITSDINLDLLPSYKIMNGGAEVRGLGLNCQNFNLDTKYLYLAIPNSWHRIQQNNKLIINNELSRPNLLFLKHSIDSVKSYYDKYKTEALSV